MYVINVFSWIQYSKCCRYHLLFGSNCAGCLWCEQCSPSFLNRQIYILHLEQCISINLKLRRVLIVTIVFRSATVNYIICWIIHFHIPYSLFNYGIFSLYLHFTSLFVQWTFFCSSFRPLCRVCLLSTDLLFKCNQLCRTSPMSDTCLSFW